MLYKPIAGQKLLYTGITVLYHFRRRCNFLCSGQLEQKGNVCVAEVFDTELIGEGALRTFKEAAGTLLSVRITHPHFSAIRYPNTILFREEAE